ncbi:MAG TPA: NrfD/PsrC family molybdoenzyme membrane anchor subunit [Candidatus Methylomirabilis sp.]|nr:NrfD/PsrC family molybdoenzyme membrane anchor subunit [Candidatus Methylomirabilis sp.]
MARLTYSQVDQDILRAMEAPGWRYYAVFLVNLLVLAWGIYAWRYTVERGLGVWGLNHPVMWAMDITNFVFWVGIAHSGTLISAVLYLFRVRWRASIYRTAEAVTVFALFTAGLFPLIHLGRPWFFYWLLPYPQVGGLWVNFRSPLVWDVFAVMTYMIISVLFFFTGLVPDLAVVRNRTTGWRRRIYGFLAQGWQGTDRQWRHYKAAYLFLAALATPLVISVHSVVSWDFAQSIVPGWHSTIFAPYFVAGAIHSGLAMVITLLIPLRRIFRLDAYLTQTHLENLAKLIILTGLIVGYAYVVESYIAWYSNNVPEWQRFLYQVTGEYAIPFWIMILFNSLVPLLFFVKRIRTSTPWLFGIAILINIGMWCERFVIIVTGLAHEYDPYSWGLFIPTWVDISITVGSFAWFFLWFLLFAKLLPVVSMVEVKEELPPPVRAAQGEA